MFCNTINVMEGFSGGVKVARDFTALPSRSSLLVLAVVWSVYSMARRITATTPDCSSGVAPSLRRRSAVSRRNTRGLW